MGSLDGYFGPGPADDSAHLEIRASCSGGRWLDIGLLLLLLAVVIVGLVVAGMASGPAGAGGGCGGG